MTRNRVSLRAAIAASASAVIVAAGFALLPGAPAEATTGTLGSLSVTPASGLDVTRATITTNSTGSPGCPADPDDTNIRATIIGPGVWSSPGFTAYGNSSNGFSNSAEISVQLSDTFKGIADGNSASIVVGKYDITLFCQDALGTQFGTFAGSIWFTDATHWQNTDPTPTTTPVTTPPTTTPPATTPAPTAPGVVAAAATGGTARVGSTMTCTVTFSGATASGYQWLRNGVAISGANTGAYKAAAADLGKGVACRATGINSVGSTSSTSAARTVVLGPALRVLSKPAILGTPKVGKVLKVTKGTWSPAGVTYHYVWLRNGKVIKHATTAKHTVVRADKGKKLTARVTATRTGWANGVTFTKARRVL